MGQARAIYVRDEDTELWARAEAYARSHRMTMSGLVLTALERLLAEKDS